MAITMKDIADAVGVSQPTVSAVLRNKSYCYVSEEKKESIRRAARDMGYQVNAIARSMATGKTRVIGFLSPDLTFEYQSRILSGCLERAETEAYFVKPFLESGDRDFSKTVAKIVENRVDGVIAIGLSREKHAALSSAVAPYDIELASVDNSDPIDGLIQIASNDAAGAEGAVEYLIELGHRQIAYFGSSLRSSFVRHRRQGYWNAITRHGLQTDERYADIDIPATVAEQISGLARATLRSDNSPTAIFCSSDIVAAHILQTAYELGLRVPNDFSLIGFGDLYASQLLAPPLTTVKQDYEEMGRRVTERLLARLKNAADYSAAVEYVPVELKIRQSATKPSSKNEGPS